MIWRSMSGRIFGVLVAGILAATALTWWISFSERQLAMSQFRESNAIDRTEQILVALSALPAADRAAFLRAAPRLGMRIEPMPAANSAPPKSLYASTLSARLGPSFVVHSAADEANNCSAIPAVEHGGPPPCKTLVVTLPDGMGIRLALLPPHGAPPPPHSDFFLNLLPFLACIGALAYLVARMTARPLNRLAQAATELGGDINRPPLAEQGSAEILVAIRAFNAMQQRIRQHIQQHTYMLAAITHDLQTPLTRLRLRLEKVSDQDLREKLIDDLSATQAMVKEGLALAASIDSTEQMKAVDLDSLLDSICLDAQDAGQDVSLEGCSKVSVMARPQALKRALVNLIDNAVNYGAYAKLSFELPSAKQDPFVRILIRDGGNGIAPEWQQKVFEPFYRIESSRSRDTGGTGLGLTIAQTIAQQHGGSLSLSNLASGGLEVCLRLPLKPV